MNTNAKTLDLNGTVHAMITMLLAFALLLGTMTLVGCGSKDEQDNCYGEDMPVVNE